ncbi:hypothetical protein HAHE_13500 [Haloferula helveola]|uniref:Uncharacterized protein n=1 Tax=Haloferula helveola TaxID=490095 RepID=A0ABM7RET0_9BACT|nr:hypothetical protein HAHE_13500 [Haloferula helveola]
MKTLLAFALAATAVTSLPAQTLLLRSGFEDGTSFEKWKVLGTDRSLKPPNDWSAAGFGLTSLPDGKKENRAIERVTDSSDPNNIVLRNTHRKTTDKFSKTEIYRWSPYRWSDELFLRFKVRFPEHMKRIEQYEPGLQDHKWSKDFLVLTEFWMDAWPAPEDRVNLALFKEKGVGKTLHWAVSHSDTYKHGHHVRTWQDVSEDAIEFGRWYTIEMYVKVGDQDHGKVIWSYQPEGGKRVERVVKKETHAAGHAPPKNRINGLVFCKLYTGRPLLEWMTGQAGSPMVNDYDDVELWSGLPSKKGE